jgi:hypothetical protein
MPEWTNFLKNGWEIISSVLVVASAGSGLWVNLRRIRRESLEDIKLKLEIEKLKAEGYTPRNEGWQAEARARAPGANKRTVDANAVLAATAKWTDAQKRLKRATHRAVFLFVVLLVGIFVLGFALGGLR